MGDSDSDSKSDSKMHAEPVILVAAGSKESAKKEKSEQSEDTQGNGDYQKYMQGQGGDYQTYMQGHGSQGGDYQQYTPAVLR